MKKISLLGVSLLVLATVYIVSREDAPVVNTPSGATSTPDIVIVAQNLEIPWGIAFLSEGDLLVTERTGDVLRINTETGEKKILFTVPGARGEGGLLGILLHPDFKRNSFVYLYMTAPSSSGETTNRVVRYVFKNDAFTQDKIIIAEIPGAVYHDGGRMEFGPDGLLYITTGDATRSNIAQDKNSLGGKILRLHDDGKIPSGNPFGTAVYAYGHRNPQGLAWDSAGRLWETEHGPTGEKGLCCRDEVNLIEAGGNYGWPAIVGDATKAGMHTPAWNSGENTWAPASALYYKGSLYFGGLRGEALYEAVLQGDRVVELKEHFKGTYGRIRTVRLGPDGMFYITTSNRDDRGEPATGDDKIIRVNPDSLK